MSCEDWLRRVEDRIDGLLTPPDTVALERHLSECPACAREAKALARLEELLRRSKRQLERPPLPAELARLVPRGPSRETVARWWITAAAVLLAVLGAWSVPQTPRRPAAARPAADQVEGTAPEGDRPVPAEKVALPENWLERLREAAAAPVAERPERLAALKRERDRWTAVYLASLRPGAQPDREWLELAAELEVIEARPALRRLLHDGTCRVAAMGTLARMGDASATAAAAAGWRAGKDRAACLAVLAQAAPEQAVPLLVEACRLETLRGMALELLRGLGATADPELAARLASRDREIRRETLALVVELGRRELAPSIHPLLEGPQRVEAVEALLTLGNAESVIPLVAAMKEARLAERIESGLAEFGGEGAAQLRRLLRSGSVAERSRAMAILGRVGDRAAAPELRSQLFDPATCRQAMAALGALGDPSAIPWLEPFLEHPGFAADALAAVAAIGGDEAVGPVARAATRGSTCRAALTALGRLGSEKALPVLLSGLRDAHGAPAAARGLAFLGDRKAVPALIGALHRPEVRRDARAALRTLTDEDFGLDPAAWRDWWNRSGQGSGRGNPRPRCG